MAERVKVGKSVSRKVRRGRASLTDLPTYRPSVGILGPGRAGLGLALALRRAGITVLGVHGRRRKPVPRGVRLSTGDLPPWLGDVDVVLLAVRDDALPGLVRELACARALGRAQVVLHLSGAQPAAVLDPLRRRGAAVGAMHPLMTVSADPRHAAARFRGAAFALDGDPAAVRAARRLARALGGQPVAIAEGAKARYHAGAVFASNYVVALLAVAEDLLVASGFARHAARRALAPLTQASVDNVAAYGPARALTGPLARGDVRTLRRHLAALPAPVRRLYTELGRATLELAKRGGLDARAARRVAKQLG